MNSGTWVPVVGGPRDGARFCPLFDARPGQVVTLYAMTPKLLPWRGVYRVSADGKRVVWEERT